MTAREKLHLIKTICEASLTIDNSTLMGAAMFRTSGKTLLECAQREAEAYEKLAELRLNEIRTTLIED